MNFFVLNSKWSSIQIESKLRSFLLPFMQFNVINKSTHIHDISG